MGNEANQAALDDFWRSTAPMSQVRENLNPPNGQYDVLVQKLDPTLDDNGLVYIQAEVRILAPASIADAKVGNTFRSRLYIGTKADPMAKLPETRLNSSGFSTLKGWARAAQVPTNDQPVAQLCANLLGKSFGIRIETSKSKKDGKEYCNFGRNPTPIGVVAARLDSEAATVSAPAPNGSAGAPQIAGNFGAE